MMRQCVVALVALALASADAADVNVEAQAARSGKGILVLQTGSDWCVSGERVRKAYESAEFRRAAGGKYVLAVFDDMDSPTDEAKAANELVKNILVRTKRFPAITCYAPGSSPRIFAQIENVAGDVTPEKLAKAVAKVTARKDQAEALFRKAASESGEKAADMYGEGFDLLASMMGPFHFEELTKGKCA